MKYIKKFIKILLKKFIIMIIAIYTPLPFSDIFSFYNDLDKVNFYDDDDDDNDDNKWKDRIKIIKIAAISLAVIFILYMIWKEGINPDSTVSGSASKSVSKSILQEKMMQKRLDNALSTTQRILEIKKNK